MNIRVEWTDAQKQHIERLLAKTGFNDLLAAWRDLLPNSPVPATDELARGQASTLIAALEARQKSSAPGEGNRSSRYLTARQLRSIDTGSAPVPVELDDDARWVLTRLSKFRAIESLIDRRLVPDAAPVNGDQPILVEHVLAYFKDWDHLAEAFGVTVPTAKAWGSTLPLSRAFEAEIKTRGHVRVPSSQRG